MAYNIVDELIKLDAGTLELPSTEVTMKLGKLKGKEFIFPVEALDPVLFTEIQEEVAGISLKMRDGKSVTSSMINAKSRLILESVPKVFKNNEIREHFKAKTPSHLVEILLLPGEMDKLIEVINDLNGYNEDKVEEIKNR